MDIYDFRLLLIGLIVLLAAVWVYLRLGKRGGDAEAPVRNRGMDNHSMGPLFGDQVDEFDLASDEAPPSQQPAGRVPQQGAPQRGAPPAGRASQESGSPPEAAKPSSRNPFFRGRRRAKQEDAAAPEPSRPDKEDIRVIYLQLTANKREGFSGSALLTMFERCNLVFGKMEVFHRHIVVAGQERHAFSVINGEEPGTLTPDELAKGNTHRIMFYISLNECHSPLKAFDEMLEVAHKFAASLDGKLYDDQGCSLSEQNIEYQRDIIRDFVHRNQVAAAEYGQ